MIGDLEKRARALGQEERGQNEFERRFYEEGLEHEFEDHSELEMMSEAQALEVTKRMAYHPEGWDGPCACYECATSE